MLFKFLRTKVQSGEESVGKSRLAALREFQKKAGLSFKNPALLNQALCHRSFVHTIGKTGLDSNERLEFLGDSVLELAVNEHLYSIYPDYREGKLTQIRSLVVSKVYLSNKARSLGLGEYLLLSREEVLSGGRNRLAILGDTYEALIGAIYLDGGWETAQQFISREILSSIEEIDPVDNVLNTKNLLQEWAQKKKGNQPRYKLRSKAGPDHGKRFVVDVFVSKKRMGTGSGRTKKEAELSSARNALEKIKPKNPDRRTS